MLEDKTIIKIVYIDDSHDLALSEYLDKYENNDCLIIHDQDIPFKKEDDYESLISNVAVREANIIIIDSKLFEDRDTSKLSGEEFKIILKKIFPFIEVLVVTQKDIEDGFIKIPKYNPQFYSITAEEYYSSVLKEHLDKAVSNILDSQKIMKILRANTSVEKYLVDKILNTMEGINDYNDLTKADIDNLVELFKEVQEAINDK